MKITPDSSVFSALSNLPSPADVRRRAQSTAEARAPQVTDPGRREKDARDAIVRQALREAAQRQAALRQGGVNEARGAAAAVSTARISEVSAAPAGAPQSATGVVTR